MEKLLELRNRRTQRTLEAYGITKILPLASLFAIVFVIYAANVAVQVLGSLLPVTVSYSPEYVLIHADKAAAIDAAWSYYPGADSPEDLAALLVNRIGLAKARDTTVLGANSRYWEREFVSLVRRFDAVKAYAVVAILLVVWQWRSVRGRRWMLARRLVMALFVFFALGGYYLASQVYALEQGGFADIRVLQSSLADEAPRDTADLAERSRYALTASRLEAERRWWTLRVADLYFAQWMRRTLGGVDSPARAPRIAGQAPPSPPAAVSTSDSLTRRMKDWLRNLVTAEESFFADSVRYTSSMSELRSAFPDLNVPADLEVSLDAASGGWHARARHRGSRITCFIHGGRESSPTNIERQGVPYCR